MALLTVAGLISGCSSKLPSGGAPVRIASTPTAVLVPQSQNLVNATITVSPGYYDLSFTVDAGRMRDARVTGSFTASGGSGNDIKVLIMDDMTFTNWKNKHQVSLLYNSGQMTIGNLNVPITASGTYHLVFDNTFSTVSSKQVATRINLEWSELKYQ